MKYKKHPSLIGKYDTKTIEGRKAYQLEWRRINRDRINERNRMRRRIDETLRKKQNEYGRLHHIKRRKELKREVYIALGNKCEVCGELEEVCLIVHHINEEFKPIRGNKSHNISLVTKYKGHLKQLENLALLCANCHRKLHAGLITLRE